ncbi:MAG: STAS domain-containing protein [Planctomycetaceae bacterium]
MSDVKPVFEFEQEGDVLVVVPTGSLIEFRDNDIRNAYNETYRLLDQDGTRHLLVDFHRLDYFGSTFVGMLIRLAKKARQGGGEAVLCNLSDNMKGMMKTLMLLENTKTDFFWVPFSSRAEALESLKPKADPAVDPVPAPQAEDQSDAGSSGTGWARFVK